MRPKLAIKCPNYFYPKCPKLFDPKILASHYEINESKENLIAKFTTDECPFAQFYVVISSPFLHLSKFNPIQFICIHFFLQLSSSFLRNRNLKVL